MRKIFLVLIILLAGALRFYKLGEVPPSLYWDETSLGYNAYSILKTARDEHGRFLPFTNFAAFGDYKPPGYIYAAVPSIALFGLNEFAVRFPSAFSGILTVILAYLIAKKLFEKEAIALLTSFLLAISPWHLQFSRGAFEANLGLFFSTLGIWLFLKFPQRPLYVLPSALSFLLAMYTFTGQRLFVPFMILILVIFYRRQVIKNFKIVVATVILSLILFWPLFVFVTRTIEGRLRFDEVTLFKDLKPINDSIRYRSLDSFSWWADLIHNRRFFYSWEYLTHYFDAFNPSFLFIRGDGNPRLSIQEVGELYLFEMPLILAGIYFLFSKNHKYRFLILGWLLISPLGPATARETPHALRMIHILPTYQLIAAYGLYTLYRMIKFKKLYVAVAAVAIILSVVYYLETYYYHWPKNYSSEWQYGYKQAVEVVKANYGKSDNIVVTRALGRPYIYFLFYMKYPPQDFWQTANVVRDRFFFINVESFDKFIFSDDFERLNLSGKVLYVAQPGRLPQGFQKISTIADLAGKPVFEIGKTESVK